MKTIKFRPIVLLLLLNGLAFQYIQAQDNTNTVDPENIEQNQTCLKCHGNNFYFYYHEGLEINVKERMNPYLIIDSTEYYNSNHKSFLCMDCHSSDYENFPHSGELRMEIKFGCMDCHEGDEAYAQYNFEQINEDFQKSAHASKHADDFTCNKCHDPHSYKVRARTSENMSEFIAYDNEICLSCHADISKYQLLTTLGNPNVLETHSWLPNQIEHFKHVRCIECHAEINDNLLVSHNILPKEQAVKLCVECHSKNSRLLASLYKFQFTDERGSLGFSNQDMLNETYVIGANRNLYLNVISISLFALVLFGLLIHALLRFFFIKH